MGSAAARHQPSECAPPRLATVRQHPRQRAHVLLLLAKAHADAIAADVRSPAEQQIGPNPRKVQPGCSRERERAVDARVEIKQVVIAA